MSSNNERAPTAEARALALVPASDPGMGALQPLKFSDEQRRIILNTCCGGASAEEATALIAIAEARGLNPLTQDCYFVKRWDAETSQHKWAVQASIDSFRAKAEETRLYAGQDEPEYEYDDKGKLKLARVRVYRRDWPRPSIGVARWEEFVQTKKDGSPTRFWSKMPHNQLAKCAEGMAFRKAFPKVFARVYTPEEMQASEGSGSAMAHEQPDPAKNEENDKTALAFREKLEAAENEADLRAIMTEIGKSGLPKSYLGSLRDVARTALDAMRAASAGGQP